MGYTCKVTGPPASTPACRKKRMVVRKSVVVQCDDGNDFIVKTIDVTETGYS